jgi:hypothetical protein
LGQGLISLPFRLYSTFVIEEREHPLGQPPRRARSSPNATIKTLLGRVRRRRRSGPSALDLVPWWRLPWVSFALWPSEAVKQELLVPSQREALARLGFNSVGEFVLHQSRRPAEFAGVPFAWRRRFIQAGW